MKTSVYILSTSILLVTVDFAAGKQMSDSRNVIPEYSPTLVYKWVTIDYNWPSNSSYRRAYPRDYRNIVLSGIKVYKGEIYVTIPRISPGVAATLNRVVEKDGEALLEPFPNWEWQKIGNCSALQTVNHMEIDHKKGWMWIIDTGRIQTFWGGLRNLCTPKLIIYDINERKVIHRYEFPESVASIRDAYLSDIAIDPEADFAFIPSTVTGTLIFYSLHDNFSIAIDHPLFKYEQGNESITIDDRTAKMSPVSAHITGITMSPRRDYILFCHLGGFGLQRIGMEFFRRVLNDPGHVSKLDNYINVLGYKVSQSRGMVMGNKNLYYGALGKQSVYRWEVSDLLSYPGVSNYMLNDVPQWQVVADDRMKWIDTLTLDADGVLWITSSNLVRYFLDVMDYHDTFNYYIWKVDVKEDSYLKKVTSPLPTTTTTTSTTTTTTTTTVVPTYVATKKVESAVNGAEQRSRNIANILTALKFAVAAAAVVGT